MEKTRLRPLEGLRNDLGKTGQAWKHECVVLFGSGVLMDDVESRAGLSRPSTAMSEGRQWEDPSSAENASRRPASIGELAERATQLEWDNSRDLKYCLRLAEHARNQAKAYQSAGDLESAFILYARAATIALEKLPAHPQYRSVLKDTQRDNLGLVRDSRGLTRLLSDHVVEWPGHPRSYEQPETCSCRSLQ